MTLERALVIKHEPEPAVECKPRHSLGAEVFYIPYGEKRLVRPAVDAVVAKDTDRGFVIERLLVGDPEPIGRGWPGCDFRWPNPVPAWREKHAIACNVHVSGRKARWGADLGLGHGWWVRVKIEWVGDCEASTFCGGYLRIDD